MGASTSSLPLSKTGSTHISITSRTNAAAAAVPLHPSSLFITGWKKKERIFCSSFLAAAAKSRQAGRKERQAGKVLKLVLVA